ncbi:MAG: fatty acid cis/trans isomerase [Cellvibrio sp.]|uniref:fatty acid cis/trans isomerase n=1 Tax=Cellvibrio sp. TaxID=1965322 RepID=UPI0031ADA87E
MPRPLPLFGSFIHLAKHLARGSLGVMLIITLGCASITGSQWDQRYGKAHPREMPTTPSKAKLTYYKDTRAILEQRCVVCHGCYDAPCQLKLESYEGLLRGANPVKVYDGTRLLGASLTRLFEDAHTTADWRTKGFHPVLNERNNTPNANIKAGVMAQFLELKKDNPLPDTEILPASFDFNLNAKQYCASIENFDSFAEKNPLWGMPYGLPALNKKEYKTTMDWLAQGAAMGTPPQLPTSVQQQVAKWEIFFNGDSLKQQLVNRYIYEHLFLAQIFFKEAPRTYFRLVRSSTPPGQPIARISTPRPYDNPNVDRVYYRLWQDPSSIVAKTHMPYALNAARMKGWQQLFFATQGEFVYEVTQLPSYAPEVASNPFVSFADLPVNARYRFMLNEAQFTIMNFIKGPVCRGQVALNVIQDHFWVFFVSPETQNTKGIAKFLSDNSKHLQLPAEAGNTLRPMTNWIKYSDLQKEYLAAKATFVSKLIAAEGGLEMNNIWNGERGKNPNAALTIFRHSDSASVHKGMIGEPPKTAWVIDYPLLERIHYLLVAGFDVYGNVSHQLLSRLYMDFLRIEGEMNFVGLLPEASQEKIMSSWYRDAESNLKTYVDLYIKQVDAPNKIRYVTDDPQKELYQKLKLYLGEAANSPFNIRTKKLPAHKVAIYEKLQSTTGKPISFLPQTTVIQIPNVGLFTLVHNSAYSNLSSLFGEEKRRIPAEDNLTIARGIVGNYPNSFMRVDEQQMDDFVSRVQKLDSEEDYKVLRDIYGVRRSHSEFWPFSDKVHQLYYLNEPEEAALLDYNRLENR